MEEEKNDLSGKVQVPKRNKKADTAGLDAFKASVPLEVGVDETEKKRLKAERKAKRKAEKKAKRKEKKLSLLAEKSE